MACTDIQRALGQFHDDAFVCSMLMFGNDPETHIGFMQEVGNYVDTIEASIGNEYDHVKEHAIEVISNAKAKLIEASHFLVGLGSNTITLVAGAAQTVTGYELYALAPITYGLSIIPGTAMVAHGANNLVEGGLGLYGLFSAEKVDNTGPVKLLYRKAATTWGYDPVIGDAAFGVMDLGLSGYGMMRKVLKKGEWKLFRFTHTQFEPAYRQMSKPALGLEILSDMNTVDTIRRNRKKP